eukprot:UN07477
MEFLCGRGLVPSHNPRKRQIKPAINSSIQIQRIFISLFDLLDLFDLLC